MRTQKETDLEYRIKLEVEYSDSLLRKGADLEAEIERLTAIIQGKPASLGLIEENQHLTDRLAKLDAMWRTREIAMEEKDRRIAKLEVEIAFYERHVDIRPALQEDKP